MRLGEDERRERREHRIKEAFKATGSLAHNTYMPNACAIFTSIYKCVSICIERELGWHLAGQFGKLCAASAGRQKLKVFLPSTNSLKPHEEGGEPLTVASWKIKTVTPTVL